MADDELLTSSRSQPLVETELLSDLLESPLIETYRYRDAGPPPTVQPTHAPLPGWPPAYEGWVVVSEEGGRDIGGASYVRSGHWTQSALYGDVVGIAAKDDMVDAYRSLSMPAAEEQRRRDGLAGVVASQGLQADIYVTEREYLHAVHWDLAHGVAVCAPSEALALVGLYLRAQDVYSPSSMFHLNRGTYFLVGAMELLPAAWRWLEGCSQYDKSSDHSLVPLANSLIRRVQRALEARDRTYIAHNRPPTDDILYDVVAGLDACLVDLMGAVDVSARVTHRVLDLATSERGAGWQKDRWRNVVAKTAPDLAARLEKRTPARDVLTILASLRNSVHGTALQAWVLKDDRRLQESSIVRIPGQETEVLEAIERLGGKDAWGARPLASGDVFIDAGTFVDALLPRILDLLNDVMRMTPVESLSQVSLAPEDCGPPAPEPGRTGIWDEWVRTSVRWQLGL